MLENNQSPLDKSLDRFFRELGFKGIPSLEEIRRVRKEKGPIPFAESEYMGLRVPSPRKLEEQSQRARDFWEKFRTSKR